MCNRKVCVVEDDLFLRIDAVSILEEAGLSVEQFSTADGAIRYLDTNAPDVAFIFTDVCMPGTMDGITLARVVEERWPWISVVITSSTLSSFADRIPDGIPVMRKPWRPVELLNYAVAAQ